MSDLRELEERMDQYDQDRQRLSDLLDSARDQVAATEEENARVEASKWGMAELCSEKDRTIRKLQSEIDSLRVEAKRDAVNLDYYRSEIRKYQQDAKVMQDRVENRR